MTEHRSRPDFYFIVAIGCAAILLLVTLLLPLGFDNDLYESMGWTLYAYHGLPYLASWDMNFPGIVFIHWASIALFGLSDFGFRIFDYFAHIVIAMLYYLVLRHWLTKRESLIAIVIYSIYYAGGQWGLAGQRDEYAVLFLLAATLTFLHIFDSKIANRSQFNIGGVAAFSTGIFSGLAFLLRPTYILFIISFAVLMLMESIPAFAGETNKELSEKKKLNFWLLAAGSILPLTVLLTCYAFQPYGLEQLYYSVIRFNLDVYSSIDVPKSFFTIGRGPIYIAATAGLFFIFRGNRTTSNDNSKAFAMNGSARRNKIMLYLFTASSLLSPIVMGKYFTYHFALFMMIAIGFAAIGLDRIARLLRKPTLQRSTVILALGVFGLTYYPRHLVRMFLHSLGGRNPVERTYEEVMNDSMYGIRAQKAVVEYLDRKMPRNTPVEVATFDPSIEWRIGRPMATRFTTLLPLMPLLHPEPDYILAWQREFITSIASVRPRYVIRSNLHRWWPFALSYEDSSANEVPGFDSLLSEDYSPDTVIRGYSLYHIRK